jgi:tRNA(His) guanylyltransferase
MKSDAFGDRMKMYELANPRKLIPLLPAMARIDGHCFHTFTRGLDRPFDKNMSTAMIETAKFLVEQTHALIGYTQSDEITLLWHQTDDDSQIYFDGRVDKMNSIIASMAASKFKALVGTLMPKKADRFPAFDCRVWNVPTRDVAIDTLIWREDDATRNSVSMAAQAYASHKTLHGKSRKQKMDLLMDNGVNWNDYPAHFKRGTYVRREIFTSEISLEELARLPEKHRARRFGETTFKRARMVEVDMPPIRRVINRIEVIFEGAQPITATEEN